MWRYSVVLVIVFLVGCSHTYQIRQVDDYAYKRLALFGKVSEGKIVLTSGDSLSGKAFTFVNDSLQFLNLTSNEDRKLSTVDIKEVTIKNRRSGRAGGFLVGSLLGIAITKIFITVRGDVYEDEDVYANLVFGISSLLIGGVTGVIIGGRGDTERYIFLKEQNNVRSITEEF